MATAEATEIACPFCGYKTTGEYQILLHMETDHPEDNNSPFVVRDDSNITASNGTGENEEIQFAHCPVEGCGEELLHTEFDSHLEMHAAELTQDDSDEKGRRHVSKKIKLDSQVKASFGTKLSDALRNITDEKPESRASEKRKQTTKEAWKGLLNIPDTSQEGSVSSSSKTPQKRLGVSDSFLGNIHHQILRFTKKSQLGPHAEEKKMPDWLVKVLERDGETAVMERYDNEGRLRKCRVTSNRAEGILPVLQQLLEQDRGVEWAFLCHPAVRHVSKLKREGGFCGYRNIQMLSSYIVDVQSQGHDNLKDRIPSIFEIQDHIEMAWDLGINKQGRTETGGIRGTRKYIGTSDAQAMFCKLGIACDAQGIKPKRLRKDTPPGIPKPPKAYDLLFANIEAYFTNGCTDYDPRIRCTNLPPVYFQHPGHSLTIVGLQLSTDGSKSLIVFDPMYHDPPAVMKHVGHKFVHKDPAHALKLYRRGRGYLEKYHEFEVLKLCPPVGLRGVEEGGDDEEAEKGSE